jgi:hypothetical protein
MQKKKSTRFKAIDFIIVLLCVAGSVLSGAAFWNEYDRTLTKLNEDPVGTIVFKKRTAQRRFIDRAVWDRLKESSQVYNGDTIRTIEYSELVIHFKNEVANLTMNENTLVQIFYSDIKGATIDFTAGNIEVNSGSSAVTIISGSSQIVLEGQAEIVKSTQGFSLSVTEGEAVFDGEVVETGKILAVNESGERDIKPAIAVTSFGSSARFLCPPSGTVPIIFTWNESNFTADTRVIVEIAQDRAFNNIIATREASGVSSVSIPLGSGNYWWRAYPATGESRESANPMYPSGTLEIIAASPITLVSPANKAELTFSEETSVSLSWTAAAGATAYLVDISANENMRSPAVSRRAEQTEITVSGLTEGNWYWRVIPVLPDWITGSIPPSDTGEFTLARGVSPMDGPELHYPADNANISGDASATAKRLFWLHDTSAEAWLVEVADNKEISNPVIKQRVIFNYFPLPENIMQDGKVWYWRVSALSGTRSAASDTRTFSVNTEKQQTETTVQENQTQTATGSQPGAATAQPPVQDQKYIIFTNAKIAVSVNSNDLDVKNNLSGNSKAGEENIQGQQKGILTLNANLARGYEWREVNFNFDESVTQKLRTATGVRFKVIGDGARGWHVRFPTKDTEADSASPHYHAPFITRNNEVVEVDIPFSNLSQTEWGARIPFNRTNINNFIIWRYAGTGSPISGNSTIIIFDLEIYSGNVSKKNINILSYEAGWASGVFSDNPMTAMTSSADFQIRRENILEQQKDVLTATVNLPRTAQWINGEYKTIDDSILQKARAGSGIRFKVLHTDGKNTGWSLVIPTRDTMADSCYYEAQINVQSGGVAEVDIPYSSLKQPDWGFQRRFNQSAISSIVIRRSGEPWPNIAGSSSIKIFDFEIY